MDQQTAPKAEIRADSNQAGELNFGGPPAAALLARQVRESMLGVLSQTFTTAPGGRFPVGFVQASVEPRYWWETMWTRDAGTFLRELVHFGWLEHACLNAACLMEMVEHNAEGFISYPRYFKFHQHDSGSELDGTGAIVIALVLLWECLDAGHPMRKRIYDFLHRDDSAVAYLAQRVGAVPLISGSGEFGGGCGIEGEYCNVVQNGLARLSLLAAARLEQQAGQPALAATYRQGARKLADNMLAHLVDADGSWIWCVLPDTLKGDPAVLEHKINKGFGGINGVLCMQSDVLGPDLGSWDWEAGIDASRRTFERLLNTPMRRRLLESDGIWTQFDEYLKGLVTSPSYGHAYAIQCMLLMGRLDLAAKALGWLAERTHHPVATQKLHRTSPYHFYERMFPDEAAGQMKLDEGAGALNLVNVSEPLKCARLILGIDDTDPQRLRIAPRLPDGWDLAEARNWPVRLAGEGSAFSTGGGSAFSPGGSSAGSSGGSPAGSPAGEPRLAGEGDSSRLGRIDLRIVRTGNGGMEVELSCRDGRIGLAEVRDASGRYHALTGTDTLRAVLA